MTVKKKINIKLLSVYDMDLFLIRNPYCLDEYEFVEGDDPDIVFFESEWTPKNDYWFRLLKSVVKKFYLINCCHLILPKAIDAPRFVVPFIPKGNYVRVFSTFENVLPQMSDCEFAFSFSSNIDDDGHFRLPNYIYRANHFNYDLRGLVKPRDYDPGKKTKFCNFIYKQSYNERNRILRLVSKISRVDCAGALFNNMNGLLLPTMKSKFDFIENYKFTLAIENSFTSGYTTEKLIEAMLCGSIPIYYGDPDVGEVFNTKSFINYTDYKSDKDFLAAIRELNEDESKYKAMLAEPWLLDNKLPPHMEFDVVETQFRSIYEAAWSIRQKKDAGI